MSRAEELHRQLDEACVEAETELAREKEWLTESVEDSLTELDAHLRTLSIAEAEAAIAGLRWYEKHFMDDQPLVMGWERLIDGTDSHTGH